MTTKPLTRRHPGKGKGRARLGPRGRKVNPKAVEEIRSLLGSALRRDLLIEYLHLLQDRYGHLSVAHLRALAEELRLPMAEVYEVATFYARFDVAKEGEKAPPEITIRVCDGVVCEMMGCQDLLASLKQRLGTKMRVTTAPCMGRCATAPVASIGKLAIDHATVEGVADVASRKAVPQTPSFLAFEEALAKGGYALLKECRSGKRPLAEILETVGASNLRGLGGAGFPSARKWEFVRKGAKPRFLVVNADESEPGTFKDRFCLEHDPHRVLEGMLIAAHAIEADAAYIYLRDEYPLIRDVLLNEIPKVEAAGLGLPGGIHLRRGAGAYVCGEESAMLESIEGKRGYPRHRPPFPAEAGLFGHPTLVQNVETLYWFREILEKGADWYRTGGALRLFSVSGRVKEPGVKLVRAGITTRALIEKHCGGMVAGHRLKAFLPGGAAGGILPAGLADLPLDFDTLEEHGAALGSASVIVLSDQDDLRKIALNLMRFFEAESCGQCTPCRAGTEKAVKLLERPDLDRALLEELSRAMADASICGLGQTAPNPVMSLFRHFPDALSSGDA